MYLNKNNVPKSKKFNNVPTINIIMYLDVNNVAKC